MGSEAPATATSKRAAVQAAVLTATEELLADGASWADLGIERIANRAGISRTAFYFYFRDKRELLMRLTEDVNEQLYAEADRWFSGHGDPEQEMREAIGKVAALYVQHRTLMRTIVEVATYDEDVAAFWRGLLGRFVAATATRLEAERRAGRAGAMPAHSTAFALVWMTERTLYQVLEQAPFGVDEAVEALLGIWLRAVYGDGPGPVRAAAPR